MDSVKNAFGTVWERLDSSHRVSMRTRSLGCKHQYSWVVYSYFLLPLRWWLFLSFLAIRSKFTLFDFLSTKHLAIYLVPLLSFHHNDLNLHSHNILNQLPSPPVPRFVTCLCKALYTHFDNSLQAYSNTCKYLCT